MEYQNNNISLYNSLYNYSIKNKDEIKVDNISNKNSLSINEILQILKEKLKIMEKIN